MKVEAVATVYYTCTLSDEDTRKVVDYIKDNPQKFKYMSDKERIIKAVEKLHEEDELNIYEDSVESDFATEEIRWSEFEKRKPEEILREDCKHRRIDGYCEKSATSTGYCEYPCSHYER